MQRINLMRYLNTLAIVFCCGSIYAQLPGTSEDCPFMTRDAVVHYFADATNQLKVRFREKPYPSCTFTWKTDKTKVMTIVGREMTVPVEGRLTLTKAPIKNLDIDWQRVISSYKSESLSEIPDIGTKAVWSDKRQQLSVLTDAEAYHVAVEVGDESSQHRDAAIRIAQQLLVQPD